MPMRFNTVFTKKSRALFAAIIGGYGFTKKTGQCKIRLKRAFSYNST
jgi:hypothetical protein